MQLSNLKRLFSKELSRIVIGPLKLSRLRMRPWYLIPPSSETWGRSLMTLE